MALSTCQSCGISLTSGPFCSMCNRRQVEISNIVDACLDWTFDVVPDVLHRSDWTWTMAIAHGLYCEQLIVLKVVAKLVGDPGDADIVGHNLLLRLLDHGTAPVFERPLNLITINEQQANAELDVRIARLERMMNVLVEQDSPAGEALRRLGGAKLEHDSPTKLLRPALYERSHLIHMRASVTEPFEIKKKVSVRVSLIGVKKYPVA